MADAKKSASKAKDSEKPESKAEEAPKTETAPKAKKVEKKRIGLFAAPAERDDLPEGIYGGPATIDNPPA